MGYWEVDLRSTKVHWCQVSVPGPAGYHCVTLGQFTPALTDSHHGQITPIIMLQSPDSQQITRTLSMEIEYR